jgi:hypothetical protein
MSHNSPSGPVGIGGHKICGHGGGQPLLVHDRPSSWHTHVLQVSCGEGPSQPTATASPLTSQVAVVGGHAISVQAHTAQTPLLPLIELPELPVVRSHEHVLHESNGEAPLQPIG